MMPLSTSLPIVVIFEQHWDKAPQELLKKMLPQLASEGYDTLCCEVPQSESEADILLRRDERVEYGTNLTNQAEKLLKQVGIIGKLSDFAFDQLTALMALYVSSKHYVDVAERIKELPALIIRKEVLHQARELSFGIKGIDMDVDDFYGMTTTDLTKRYAEIQKYEDIRIKSFTDNLFALYKEGKGLIFPCGALHAHNVISKFKEKNMQDHVLYYFPHSKTLIDNANTLANLKEHSPELKDHSYCILNERDSNELAAKIFSDIQSKIIPCQEDVLDGIPASGYLIQIYNSGCNIS